MSNAMVPYRTSVLPVLLFAGGMAGAQPITLRFTAEFNSVHHLLDSVLVMNLTQGGDTLLLAPDTVLVLDAGTFIAPASAGDGNLQLRAGHPNPFGDAATFDVVLHAAGRLVLGATDPAGREVAALAIDLPRGMHRFTFSGGAAGPVLIHVTAHGTRRTLQLLGLADAPRAAGFRYAGATGDAPFRRDAQSLFLWSPGDALRYIGYATLSPGVRLGAAIDGDVPTADATHLFTLRHGVPCTDAPFTTDGDGNSYRTVQIGTQCWTARNLFTTSYANGDPLPEEDDDVLWEDLLSGAWCHYDNNSVHDTPYGKLYNWYAVVDPRNVCPAGWHVPDSSEWNVLAGHLGGLAVAGGKLKSTGSLWSPPNTGATNESGFTGQPGGYRYDFGDFASMGGMGAWWSATGDALNAWRYTAFSDLELLGQATDLQQFGCSVRCVKDP